MWRGRGRGRGRGRVRHRQPADARRRAGDRDAARRRGGRHPARHRDRAAPVAAPRPRRSEDPARLRRHERRRRAYRRPAAVGGWRTCPIGRVRRCGWDGRGGRAHRLDAAGALEPPSGVGRRAGVRAARWPRRQPGRDPCRLAPRLRGAEGVIRCDRHRDRAVRRRRAAPGLPRHAGRRDRRDLAGARRGHAWRGHRDGRRDAAAGQRPGGGVSPHRGTFASWCSGSSSPSAATEVSGGPAWRRWRRRSPRCRGASQRRRSSSARAPWRPRSRSRSG